MGSTLPMMKTRDGICTRFLSDSATAAVVSQLCVCVCVCV